MPVNVFGLDVTKKRKVLFDDLARWESFSSPLVRDIYESVLGFMKLKAERFGQDNYLGYFHDVDLFTFGACNIEIGLDGDNSFGNTKIDFDPAPSPETIISDLFLSHFSLLFPPVFLCPRAWLAVG